MKTKMGTFFPFRVNPILEGAWCAEKQRRRQKSYLSLNWLKNYQVYQVPFRLINQDLFVFFFSDKISRTNHLAEDMRWLLHRSPWIPTSTSAIPNGTGDFPSLLEDLMNETEEQHLIFKLKPKKVFDGGISISEYRKSRRRKMLHVTNDYNDKSRDTSEHGRRKRDVMVRMPERTVETLVVIDRMMLEFHKSKELLQPYVLTIMNIVSMISYNCDGKHIHYVRRCLSFSFTAQSTLLRSCQAG